jgi:hypothetical protein
MNHHERLKYTVGCNRTRRSRIENEQLCDHRLYFSCSQTFLTRANMITLIFIKLIDFTALCYAFHVKTCVWDVECLRARTPLHRFHRSHITIPSTVFSFLATAAQALRVSLRRTRFSDLSAKQVHFRIQEKFNSPVSKRSTQHISRP